MRGPSREAEKEGILKEVPQSRKKMDEARIQQEIVLLLQSHGVFCHSVPNEGAGGDRIRASKLVGMGLRAGVADLVVWWPAQCGVRVGYLEVKDERGKQSDRQKAFERKCREAGIPYDLVRSPEEAGELLRRYGKEQIMIEIEKHGQAERIKAVCYRCGCVFTFTESDEETDSDSGKQYVTCPDCAKRFRSPAVRQKEEK